jgi:hypothetical protein
MTKQIPLGGKDGVGKFALVDDEDYERISKYNWFIQYGYAITNIRKNGKQITIRMHREVLGLLPEDKNVPDHIDFNRLNNQKNNLRIATRKENSRYNFGRRVKKTSKYKGVIWSKKDGLWAGVITVDNKNVWCGLHSTQREAAIAYNEAAVKHFGEFAYLNEIPNEPDPDDQPVIRKTKQGQVSGYKGVVCNGKTWGAHFAYKKITYHLGYFPTPEQAAKAYDAAVMKYIGPKGKFNFPESINDLPNIDLPMAVNAASDKRTRKSNFRGVSLHTNGQWTMRIFYQGKRIQEYFDTEIDAAKAYDKYAKLKGGKVIYLNFPDDTSCHSEPSAIRKGHKTTGATSNYIGVYKYPNRKKPWSARIKLLNGQYKSLGYFATEIEAAKAYDQAAINRGGKVVRINFPE